MSGEQLTKKQTNPCELSTQTKANLRTAEKIDLHLSKYLYWILVTRSLSIGNILEDWFTKSGIECVILAKSSLFRLSAAKSRFSTVFGSA